MKKDKPKDVKVKLIPPGTAPYKMMEQIRKKHHHWIRRARIALVLKKKMKPDKDGHLVLGRCQKMTDTVKELAPWDFVIYLNKEVWNDEEFGKKRQVALLDHELCHAAPVYNKSGKQKKDIRGNYVFRYRDHEIEEFREIVERHGCYKKDLELFAEALLKKRKKK